MTRAPADVQSAPTQPATGGLRVLHVAEAVRGGVATYLRTLVQQQCADPSIADVRVLVPAGHEEELGPIAPHLTTVPPARSRLATALSLALRARQLSGRQGLDVVHLHSTFAGLAGRLLRPHASALVYCPHGWAFDRHSGPAMTRAVRSVERRLAGRGDAIVAISAHERDAGLRIGIAAERVHLVRSGLAPWPATVAATPDAADPWPARPGLRLLFVGRFDRQKAFDTFAAVARELPAANCVAIGDYSVDAPREQSLPANVHTPGWQSPVAVHCWMRHANLLVMPSRWEGFGLTAVEAMRAGLPVIATRVGGLQEIVIEGRTGWLVMPDDVQAIVHHVQQSTPEQLRALGAAGHARYAALFTAERMHRELLALYRHCLGQRAARSALPPAAAPGAVSISRR